MIQERRVHGRIGIDVSARIFNSAGEIILGEGKIMDISTGGAKLETVAGLNTGETLQLEFLVHKPDRNIEKDKVTLVCEVETIWKKSEEGETGIYGVKFINLSPIAKELILKLIDLLNKYKKTIDRKKRI